MTVDPMILNTFLAVMTILVCGIGIKIGYNWLKTGRVQTKEIYRTVDECDSCRQHCCVNVLKTQFADHVRNESGADSRVDQRLSNIEDRIKEAREDTAKMREEAKQETTGIRQEVQGIRSALDTMAGLFEGYVKRSDDRDRRTGEIGSQQ